MKLNKIIYLALIGLFATSCTEDLMDDINKDHSNPPSDKVPVAFQITDGIMASAFTTSSGAYAWYASSLTEQEFGAGNNQFMKLELRNRIETASSSTYNNEWNGTYANLQNLKQIIEKCDLKGGADEGKLDIKGMAQVLYALNFGILTDLHGDIPCSEALKGLDNLQPNVDKQEDIYKNAVIGMLDKGIENLTAASQKEMENAKGQDILFANDLGQWIASAHALKARYLLHTSFRNNAILKDVIIEAQAALTGGFKGMNLTVFDGNATANPWWSFYASRTYTGVTTTMTEILNDRKDPRYGSYVAPYINPYTGKASPIKISKPGDQKDAIQTDGLSRPAWLNDVFGIGADASIQILSLAELNFILAEAQARTGASAVTAFNNGVLASIKDYDKFARNFVDVYDAYVADIEKKNETLPEEDKITPLSYSDYLPTMALNYVKTLSAKFTAAPVTEILVQKYIALARDGQIETYNDIRRTKAMGEEFVKFQNPNNIAGGANNWPERMPYGNSSVTANPIIKALYGDGSYVFTEKIWLYGGTR